MFKFFILLSLSLSLSLGTTMVYGEEAQESHKGEVSEQQTIILGRSDGELVVCRSTSRGLVCEDPNSFSIVISTCIGKEGADLTSCLYENGDFDKDEYADVFYHRLGPVMGLRHNFKSAPPTSVMDYPTGDETDLSDCAEKEDLTALIKCLDELRGSGTQ